MGKISATFLSSARKYSIMVTHGNQPAATKARRLLNGSRWDPKPRTCTTILLITGLREMAIQYNLWSPRGASGAPTMGEYINGKIIADIREIEKKQTEKLLKKLEEGPDNPDHINP